MSSPVASSSSHTNPRKRPRARPSSSLTRQQHASSGRISMDSLSSPITVATSNQGSNNKDVKGKGKLIILPPDWSSDEEDELRSSCSDDESEGGLAKKRNSSQLTEKEAKKNAMKRLRKARRDKTTKAPYISPAKKKARLDGKSAKASPVKYDSEIDELASQQSMKSERFSLGKMPWESDSDDEDNPRKKVSEPIYEEKVKATNEFDDLPPALPPPEKVWTRKARPPSRRDLFDASQRPDPPKQSSPPPARTRDDPNELPDLVLPSSANMKTSDPPSTPQDRELEARCRSPTIEELPKLDVGHSDEVSPGDSDLAHLSEPKNSAENIVKSDIESAQQPEKTPELHYAVPEPDYCGDTSYGDGDLSLEFEDMELAAMRPFFTPEPEPEQPPPVGLPLGPSATAELDALIADAEFEAAQEAARQAEEESAMAEEAIQSSSTSLNAPGKIEANMPTKQLIRDQMSSSTMPSPKQENMVKDPVQIAQISKTTTTSNLPDAKGKGKARQDSADSPLVKGHREEVTQIEDSDQELWHDFDDIMPLEDEVVPRQSSNKGSRRDMFSPDVPAISKVPGSSSASSARAGGSSSKLPSSEEESQPCSFCGMIYPISSLPMHAEACQAAQEAAAASHEDKASIVTQKKFNFREDSSPRKITSKSALSSTRTKQGQRNATDQNTDKDEADKLEAMLFGQPNVKARQTEVTTSKKDKGKGRATDESDPLTSPDVPIRSLRSSLMAGQNQNVKVSSRVDASDWVDNQDTASDKRESGRRKPLSTVSKRNEPIRAPQPAGRSSPPRPANGVAYPYNSPPAGAIFLDQLPLDVQRGYYRLIGLDQSGEIASRPIEDLIEKPRPLPQRNNFAQRGGWRGRARGRGGGVTRMPVRGTTQRRR